VTFFPATGDPGPSFLELLNRTGGLARPLQPPASGFAGGREIAARAVGRAGAPEGGMPHGTTIAAIRYDRGIVMAGDRRATEGHAIAHRAIEKVFPGDRYSAVAIAGVAGPAVEMVKLFQTQLEHYEKVEGIVLSLEGKANQLSMMVRSNFGMAMEGLVVVPLFGGWDSRRGTGRIFTYDVTGGRYEEADFHATGSGGRDARTTIKLGYRDGMTRGEAIELVVRALYQAADEDSATGGPDPVRGIYPMIATVESDGYSLIPEDEVAAAFERVVARLDASAGAVARSGTGGPVKGAAR
jgi:proteasome beta subunit